MKFLLKQMPILILAFFLFIILHSRAFAKNRSWFYPMADVRSRAAIKPFGQFLDEKFYSDKNKLFPGELYLSHFHAGVDLEIYPTEARQLVPIYAIADGIIVFAGEIEGYGGLILLQINDNEHTALYGHVKLLNLKIKLDDKVRAGQLLGYLGDAFSKETAGERKHLHFGIYRDHELYFRGHENTRQELNEYWENPLVFLGEKGAVSPEKIVKQISTAPPPNKLGLIDKIINFFK